ncbi:hypothetical protein GSS88_06280 [Corynebacterium sp. 3HC-13]|uniref:hypothetical protein n=1 Tax=Corynebacterium poyangense TaxID=2684405 RepID=UPI001CCEC067|nr:hypothetical protein [Corynebacterium poyangense]MBZ8177404.1 hypothetical protein [Corynebacterium poyangense]
MKFRRTASAILALAFSGSIAAHGVASADLLGSSGSGGGRPFWDPTQVNEADVKPDHAEGKFGPVTFTDAADGDHVIPFLEKANAGKGPYYGRVQTVATGYTPGQYYTVRVTLRTADNGADWGVYTWQTYQATAQGELHIDLRIEFPSRAQVGERIVAAPAVYNANDIRRDGRPNKVDPKCVLNCERVAPLTKYKDYSNPDSIITIGQAE